MERHAPTQVFAAFMGWVDDARVMEVFTNADTPADALEARRNGAQGIGLTRTEHMFFEPESRLEVRKTTPAHASNATFDSRISPIPISDLGINISWKKHAPPHPALGRACQEANALIHYCPCL